MSDGPSSSCPCSDPQDPEVVSNPPGLPSISYRVDDFTGFRRALLRSLPGEQAIGNWQAASADDALQSWRPAPGDLGLMVLEWWAYLADILTFYNERIANESYLRTAQLPASLAGLVALIGYEPAPALAATGTVAAIRSAGKPGLDLLVPPAMRLASAAANGIPSQVFEVTTTTTTTFSGPSDVPVTLVPDDTLQVAGSAPLSVLLAGTVSGVKANDRLVLVPIGYTGLDGADTWSYVTVASVTPSVDAGTGKTNTLVTFDTGTTADAGWGPQPQPSPPPPAPSPSPYPGPSPGGTPLGTPPGTPGGSPGGSAAVEDLVVRRAAAMRETPAQAIRTGLGGEQVVGSQYLAGNPGILFEIGDSVGPPAGAVSTGYRLLKPTATTALWSANTTDPAVAQDGGAVHLAGVIRAISPGDLVLFDTGAGSAAALAVVASSTDTLFVVPFPDATSSKATPPPEIVVSHSKLDLDLPYYDALVLTNLTNPATVTVRYAFKDVGTVIPVPQQQLPALGGTAWVPASYDVPSGGVTGFLVDATGQGVFVKVTAAGQYPASGTAEYHVVNLLPTGTPPSSIVTPFVPPLRLLLDLLPVSRGQTVANEVLGSGNAALTNQSFTLAKSPLTYLASGNGWTSTLSVWVGGVGGIRWQEVDTFFDQPAGAQVYVVSRSADQTVTTVTFGDGVNGARLPTGSGNVVATYRYGSGQASPPAGTLTTIMQPQPLLSSIRNPVAVAPGKDPEAPADLRANAPASIFTFGRAISALDYEVVAAQAPGVSRVSAVWSFDGDQQRTLVTVYVGDDGDAVAAAAAALAGAEDPNRPISVQPATPIELGLSCTLVVAADRQIDPVTAAAASAVADQVVGLFSPSQMGIGAHLYRSAVDAALSVPGVVAVHDLAVTWPQVRYRYSRFLYERMRGAGWGSGGAIGTGGATYTEDVTLDEVFDPGEGNYFVIGTPSITGVYR